LPASCGERPAAMPGGLRRRRRRPISPQISR